MEFLINLIIQIKLRYYKRKVSKNLNNFDNTIDYKIGLCSNLIYKFNGKKFIEYKEVNDKNVGILATQVYDIGGHTQCISRFIDSFYEDYNLTFFLVDINNSEKLAPKRMNIYRKLIKIKSTGGSNTIDKIISLYNNIINSEVKILFVYMHMQDVISCTVLALLNKHTKIKIVFFNHADHLFSLGFGFAHLIIEARKQGQFLTENISGQTNTIRVPLQSMKKEDTVYFSKEQITEIKQSLGINKGELLTLSGFSSNKIFADDKYEYFYLIKRLLKAKPNLKHVLITEFDFKQQKTFESIFEDEKELLNRFIVKERVADFDIFLQAADVFIDSFPIGSALTHIDMMRNKKPTVVKINTQNEIYSFQDYMPENYKYAFANIDEMQEGILFLLENKKEQKQVIKENYQHFLNTNEFFAVKKRYKDIIESSHNIESLYISLPKDYKCELEHQ